MFIHARGLSAFLALCLAATGRGALPAGTLAVLSERPSLIPADGPGLQGSTDDVTWQRPGAATGIWQARIRRKPAQRWEVGLKWSPPIDIAKDQVLVLAFEGRVPGTDREKGRIECVVRTGPKPYIRSLGEELSLSDAWQQFTFVFPAAAAMPADTALFGINMGAQAQTVEIRAPRAVAFEPGVTVRQARALLGVRPTLRASQVVGEPLSPNLLWLMGALDTFTEPREGFSPDGAWHQEFLIWTCHGYLGRANKAVGYLTLERTPVDGARHELKVRQELVNDRGILHVSAATATCRTDAAGTPLSWHLTSRFSGPGDTERPELREDTLGRTTGTQAFLRRGKAGERLLCEHAGITADWCLFEAVQRLDPDPAIDLSYCLLEGMDTVKPDHALHFGDVEIVTLNGRDRRLFRYAQTGRGTLPCDFWVDVNTRQLVAVITHSRAYIQTTGARAAFLRHARSQKAPALPGTEDLP